MTALVATALAALSLASAAPRTAAPQTAPAQTAPTQTAPATSVDDVEVTARRETAYAAARRFLDEVVETPQDRGLARWDGKVCVGVINMQAAVAQQLVDRVSDRIAELDLPFGEPGCKPNILIVATADGAAAAHAMVESRPRAFNTGVGGANLSKLQLQAFQDSQAPVRWWRLTIPVDSETGAPIVRLPGEGAQLRDVSFASRIRSQDRNLFVRTFIILDMPKMEGVDLNAVGDYVAMVSLAQIDADADVSGYSSILNLFNDPAGTRQMTEWDHTYLRSLYDAELNERHTRSQMGSVASAMARSETSGVPAVTTDPR